MKKLVCAAVVLAVGSSVFASENPTSFQELKKSAVSIMVLSASGELRRSSDAIAIPAAKKRMDRDGDVHSSGSSGSSPVGAEHLFPGQSGLGQWGKYMAPVSRSDENLRGRADFFH